MYSRIEIEIWLSDSFFDIGETTVEQTIPLSENGEFLGVGPLRGLSAMHGM